MVNYHSCSVRRILLPVCLSLGFICPCCPELPACVLRLAAASAASTSLQAVAELLPPPFAKLAFGTAFRWAQPALSWPAACKSKAPAGGVTKLAVPYNAVELRVVLSNFIQAQPHSSSCVFSKTSFSPVYVKQSLQSVLKQGLVCKFRRRHRQKICRLESSAWKATGVYVVGWYTFEEL